MTIDIKTTIAWCAGVAVTCISGTYLFTDNNLKSELAQYKESEKWQLPKLLSDLGKVSEELHSRLSDNNEIERLKRFEALHRAEFQNLQAELKEAKKRLEVLEGPSVFLDQSRTVPLGEPGLLLGMTGTMFASDGVNLRVGEESLTLEIGERGTYKSSTTKYTFSYKGRDFHRGYEIVVVRSPIDAKGVAKPNE